MSYDTKVMWSFRALNFIFVISGLLQQSTAAVNCNGKFNIYPNYIYNVESPNYPNYYSPYTQSICKFTAPRNYKIQANCYVDLPQSDVGGCTTEKFFISEEGDIKFRDSEEVCGNGTIPYNSLFRSIAFGLSSSGSQGRYQCRLQAKPQQCDCGWSINTKIVNGVEASPNEFPSIALLILKSSVPALYCSGTIISYRHILTAAHCADMHPNPNEIEVWVGRHDIASTTDTNYAAAYDISKIIKHPDYDHRTSSNDIALMITKIDIEYSRGVGPICLPPLSNINDDFANTCVDVIGWGAKKFGGVVTPKLQKATLSIVENANCKTSYSTLTSTQICTYDYGGNKRDTCQYDSGGPVIYRSSQGMILIGIISYGMECGVKPYAFAVNTRVTSYLNWIHANVGSLLCSKWDQNTNYLFELDTHCYKPK